MTEGKNFDVIIIGGSYAGLSAAMALGRALRKVLIIDYGLPCNRQTPHSHNFLTQDGKSPQEINALAKEQVGKYETVKFYHDLALTGKKTEAGFEIGTQSGNIFVTKKLIFASGIKDIMPDIPGFAECWGISIIHCPFCHGYEVRSEKTGILANGDMGFELVKLISNWTKDLTLFTNGKSTLTEEQAANLKKHNISIIETKISHFEHNAGILQNIVLNDNSRIAMTAVYTRLSFEQNSEIPVALGCELTDQGFIRVDNMQKTNIIGIVACGDNVTPMRSVANAVYTGSFAGVVITKELIEEEF